jgi:hypothetical protein
MGDHDQSWAGRVVLGEYGDGFGDGREISRVWLTRGCAPCFGLGFVAEEDVDIGEDLLDLSLEELGDEGS